MIHRCDVAPEDFGPLLLGQLRPSRARAVAAQVADCPLCAQEAAALAQVVAALAAYPPLGLEDEDEPVTAAPAVLDDVLAEVRRQRGRRRRRVLAAAATAAAVLVAGGAAVREMAGPRQAGTGQRADVAVALAGGAGTTGRATLADRRWGTDIRLQASGLDAGAVYGVWLDRADGGRLPAGSFSPTSTGTVDLRLSTALPLPAGRVLGVTRLPDARSPAPVDVREARLPS